ncbi:YcaO-like family protein [Lagierella sp.]|uniref:YcaO-like family protein n=1 Tax=Lagierella sp. TaxID=2849657 RepID=UPI00261ED699|nr:YcaO-like family protein [Lagierella sp.]
MYTINNLSRVYKISEQRAIVENSKGYFILTGDLYILEEILGIINLNGKLNSVIERLGNTFDEEDIKRYLQVLINLEIITKKVDKNTMVKNIIAYGNQLCLELFSNINSNVKILKDIREATKFHDPLLILFLDKKSNDDIININKFLLNHNIKFVLLRKKFNNYILGPYVIPWESACVDCCIKSLFQHYNSINSGQAKICNNEISKLEFSEDLINVNINELTIILKQLNDQILNIAYKSETYLANKEIIIKFKPFLNVKESFYASTSLCKSCNNINKNIKKSTNVKKMEIPQFEYNLGGSDIFKYFNGGTRISDYEASYKKLKDSINALDLSIKIEPDYNSIFKDIMITYNSKCEGLFINNMLVDSQLSYGKGITEEQAFLSAGYELVERISSKYRGEQEIIRGSFNTLKKYATDVGEIVNYAKELSLPYERFDKDMTIDWVWGYSLIDRNSKLIPASLVFLSDAYFYGDYLSLTSSGLSASENYLDAILQALLEIIEHDSWMIYQSTGISTDTINYDSINDSRILSLINKIRLEGFEVISKNYTSDLGIPVIKSWIYNKKDYLKFAFSGFGASFIPEIALERSITEAIQAYPYYVTKDNNRFYRKTHRNFSKDHVSLYGLSHFYNSEIKNDTKIVEIGNVSEIKNVNTIQEAIGVLLKKIRKTNPNLDIIVVNLRSSIFNIPTVKVIVTGGLQTQREPMLIAAERTLKYKMRNGNKRSYLDLYLGPYPH